VVPDTPCLLLRILDLLRLGCLLRCIAFLLLDEVPIPRRLLVEVPGHHVLAGVQHPVCEGGGQVRGQCHCLPLQQRVCQCLPQEEPQCQVWP